MNFSLSTFQWNKKELLQSIQQHLLTTSEHLMHAFMSCHAFWANRICKYNAPRKMLITKILLLNGLFVFWKMKERTKNKLNYHSLFSRITTVMSGLGMYFERSLGVFVVTHSGIACLYIRTKKGKKLCL